MADIMSISSIIPSMVFGIVLILSWLPVIVLTEKNNKGNQDEFKLLKDKITSNLKLTDVDITYQTVSKPIVINLYNLTNDDLINQNILAISYKNTTSTDSNNKTITTRDINPNVLFIPVLINGVALDEKNYTYLAMQNKMKSLMTIDPTNPNITYDTTIYSIPKDKTIMKVEGLQQFKDELDMTIYDYEIGPEDNATKTIINRKSSSDNLQMWVGRIGTFLMLFVGLSLLISPLTYLNEVGDSLPGPLKLLAIPGKIIASLYETLSFFGSIILTVLMTFLVWSIINMPMVSILIGGLLIGLLLYFHKK